jgi:hypothetical protein
MLKPTIRIVAAAALLAAGSLAAAPPAAAATAKASVAVSIRGPNFFVGFGTAGFWRPYKVCEPTYKRIWYWSHGHRKSKLVQTGVKCHWVYPHPPRHPGWRFP